MYLAGDGSGLFKYFIQIPLHRPAVWVQGKRPNKKKKRSNINLLLFYFFAFFVLLL
jgi:hypothetical protein